MKRNFLLPGLLSLGLKLALRGGRAGIRAVHGGHAVSPAKRADGSSRVTINPRVSVPALTMSSRAGWLLICDRGGAESLADLNRRAPHLAPHGWTWRGLG